MARTSRRKADRPPSGRAPHVALVGAAVLMLLVGMALGVGIGLWLKPSVPTLPVQAVAPPPPLPPPPSGTWRAPRDLPRQPAPEVAAPALAEPPQWRRSSVAAPDPGGRPMVAVVIDDMGVDRRRSERIAALPGPLTLAWLTYADDLPRQTAAARGRGHELLVHVAMEPLNSSYNDPGPHVLGVAQPADDLRRRLRQALDSFDGHVGINNHMGSRFTAHAPGMAVVMEELRARGLLFLDSRTTERSVAAAAAGEAGVPFAARNVFLDNESDVAAVRIQLRKLEEAASRGGFAIGIGHPRDATIAALAEWLPDLERRGLALVPLTAIVARQNPGG